jgi:hypothetical protein
VFHPLFCWGSATRGETGETVFPTGNAERGTGCGETGASSDWQRQEPAGSRQESGGVLDFELRAWNLELSLQEIYETEDPSAWLAAVPATCRILVRS